MKIDELIEFYEKELALLTIEYDKTPSVRVADMLYTDKNRVREILNELKILNVEDLKRDEKLFCDCGHQHHQADIKTGREYCRNCGLDIK